ncbi:hypothetical protein TSUD_318420 [Trifolium subterraneum]|uniref:Thioesterase domain-containing protein n=1 Tax=Trifolium subterraneum TaxID=3900 RepID=A0A2Z6N450_TRISU|nr:hypothetical protein TSUD_318420 [Trifolium subterraneum]
MEKTDERKLESVKRYLEENKGEESASSVNYNKLPRGFLEHLILRGLHLHLIQPGRVLFSMNIPPRLLNSANYFHVGAITTLVDVAGAASIPAAGFPWLSGEEIEIDAKVLRVGKTIAAVSVEFRKKKTGQIFAQGRHTKYLPRTSKL